MTQKNFSLKLKILNLLKCNKLKNLLKLKKNLNANAEKGSLLSTIGCVVINADDQSKIKIIGKALII